MNGSWPGEQERQIRYKQIICEVITKMETEGKQASTSNLALGLRCSRNLVRQLRRELVMEGRIKPNHEDSAWSFRDGDKVPQDLETRVALVRAEKLRMSELHCKGILGLSVADLDRILPV